MAAAICIAEAGEHTYTHTQSAERKPVPYIGVRQSGNDYQRQQSTTELLWFRWQWQQQFHSSSFFAQIPYCRAINVSSSSHRWSSSPLTVDNLTIYQFSNKLIFTPSAALPATMYVVAGAADQKWLPQRSLERRKEGENEVSFTNMKLIVCNIVVT